MMSENCSFLTARSSEFPLMLKDVFSGEFVTNAMTVRKRVADTNYEHISHYWSLCHSLLVQHGMSCFCKDNYKQEERDIFVSLLDLYSWALSFFPNVSKMETQLSNTYVVTMIAEIYECRFKECISVLSKAGSRALSECFNPSYAKVIESMCFGINWQFCRWSLNIHEFMSNLCWKDGQQSYPFEISSSYCLTNAHGMKNLQ